MKKIDLLKRILYIPVMLIAMAAIFYLLLVFVYSLPAESMQKHMAESSYIFREEGTYPRKTSNANSQLDNYTDAIMLLTASYPDIDNVWEDAINAERYTLSKEIVPSESPADMLVYLYEEGNEEALTCSYARYWHGYLVFLKPLLLILNYSEIRTIIKVTQIILFAIVLLKMYKKESRLVIPLFATGIFLNLSATTKSLQFNSILMITLIALLIIMQLDDRLKKQDLYSWGFLFMVIGSIASYVDLLTYPLVSLGLPLTLWSVINYSEKFITNIKRILHLSAFWGIGYGGTWSLKWIIGTLITKENVIGNAVNTIAFRTSSQAFDVKADFFNVVIRQLGSAIQKWWLLIVLLMCILWVVYVLKKKRIQWNLLMTFMFISVYPLIWYFLLKNHSYIHCWFTYRELAISNFAMLSYIMLEICGEKKLLLPRIKCKS